ncbi:heterokaryon incompatibility protein-domain-containing protein [Xylaria grammica]|nr:heterokaryon incompatibility protein-domain-containing protein [Xylaria grammica]
MEISNPLWVEDIDKEVRKALQLPTSLPPFKIEWASHFGSIKDFFSQASPFLRRKGVPQDDTPVEMPPRLVKSPNFEDRWQVKPNNNGAYVDEMGERVSVRRRDGGRLSDVDDIEWAAYNGAKLFILLGCYFVKEDQKYPPCIAWHLHVDLMLGACSEKMKHLLLLEMKHIKPELDYKINTVRPPKPYPYPPLSEPSAIRLVVLLPSKKRHSDIVCRLCNGTLRDKYEALSYVWGDASKRRSIMMNDESFEATENLEKALRNLRSRDTPRVLWVDSMCINQTDNDERSSQVQQMDLIYSNSQRVIVWLGPESEDSSLAMDVCKRLVPEYPLNKSEFLQWTKVAIEEQRQLGVPMAKRERYAIPRIAANNHLIRRTWFTRIWCVQEFILGQRVVFQCGQKTLASEHLEQYITRMSIAFTESIGILPSTGGKYSAMRESQQSAVDIGRFFSWKSRFRNFSVPVLGLLYDFSQWESSDPRDKVFGLYGIVPEHNPDRKVLKPDYHLSVAEVYTKVAIYFLSEYGNLDVLSIATQPTKYALTQLRFPYLPSWVPDWQGSQQFIIERGCKPIAFYRSDGDGSYFDGIYNASLDRKATPIDVLNCDEVLVLDGIDVDVIDVISDPYLGFMGTRPGKHQETFLKWKEIAGLSKESRYRFSDQPIYEAWWRTILGDAQTDDEGSGVGSRRRLPPKDVELDWLPSFPPPIEDDSEALKIATRKKAPMCGRKFFKTSMGLFGLAPGWAGEGDRVVVLFGGRCPFILRKYGWYHHIVGESYVHGIMDGEIFRGQRIKEFQDLGVTRYYIP